MKDISYEIRKKQTILKCRDRKANFIDNGFVNYVSKNPFLILKRVFKCVSRKVGACSSTSSKFKRFTPKYNFEALFAYLPSCEIEDCLKNDLVCGKSDGAAVTIRIKQS